jgi:D-alanine-D-alanine ligase
MPIHVGFVYDLRSEYVAAGYPLEVAAEFDSDETIDAIENALRALGHRVDRIGSARALCSRLAAGDKWDLVFNIAEGLSGRSRESQVPAILELYGVPYTFSDPFVMAAGLDKAVAKRLVAAARIPTAKFRVIASAYEAASVNLPYPLFAKPLAEGSSKGVSPNSIARTPAELAALAASLIERFAQPVLVEEYLPGREFTVGLLGTASGARVLGVVEVQVSPDVGGEVYSYESKERCEQLIRYSTLAAGPLRKKVEKLALAAYRILECRDAGRVDVRCDARGRPNFIEINPLPGLHPTHSDLPMIAAGAGMTYTALIGSILESASERLGISL